MSRTRSDGPDDADAIADACCGDATTVDEAALAEDVQLLSALGNDTRYELLCRIVAAGDGVCVCDLEAAVGISQSGVSQALSRLYTAGLVTRRKEGSWRYYEPTDAALTLLDALAEVREDV